MEKCYYIGVMSGTSADGIDIALVDFSTGVTLLASDYYPYQEFLYQEVTSLYQPNNNELDRAGELSVKLAHAYASAIELFLKKHAIDKAQVIAIGNHGQTVRHRPDSQHAFTLQLGCNQTLAALTNMRVVGDFRTRDIAYGGQGAPLVPAFHRALLGNTKKDTFLINIGGIANITYLPHQQGESVLGFDTGPGNCLMDAWCYQHTGKRFDANGQWASRGQVDETMLNFMLEDNYFKQALPKSTGREYFNKDWLEHYLTDPNLSAESVQATLLALTATTIADAVNKLSTSADVYITGGGKLNQLLVDTIKRLMPSHQFSEIEALSVNNDAFEAMAFAWLAYAYDKKIYGNIPAVTGARKEAILGNVSFP